MIYLITNLKHKAQIIAKNTQHKLQLLVNNHCNPMERITSLLFLSHSSLCFMCGQSSFCYNVMSKIVDVNIRMWTIDTIPLNTGKRSPIKFCCSVGQHGSRVFESENEIHCSILDCPRYKKRDTMSCDISFSPKLALETSSN